MCPRAFRKVVRTARARVARISNSVDTATRRIFQRVSSDARARKHTTAGAYASPRSRRERYSTRRFASPRAPSASGQIAPRLLQRFWRRETSAGDYPRVASTLGDNTAAAAADGVPKQPSQSRFPPVVKFPASSHLSSLSRSGASNARQAYDRRESQQPAGPLMKTSCRPLPPFIVTRARCLSIIFVPPLLKIYRRPGAGQRIRQALSPCRPRFLFATLNVNETLPLSFSLALRLPFCGLLVGVPLSVVRESERIVSIDDSRSSSFRRACPRPRCAAEARGISSPAHVSSGEINRT